jgi:hypothetical protein
VPTIPPNLSGFGMSWFAPARMPAYGVKRPTASAPVSPTCRPMSTEREMARLRTEREQARRPLWQRLLGLKR